MNAVEQSPQADLDTLCAIYRKRRGVMTQFEMAQAEDEIWRATGEVKQGRSSWFRDKFGAIEDEVAARGAVLKAGTPAINLWAAIETRRMTIRDAAAVMLEAHKCLFDKDGPEQLSEAVEIALAEYFDKHPPIEKPKPVVAAPMPPPPEPVREPDPPPAPKPEPAPAPKPKKTRVSRGGSADAHAKGGVASARLRRERYGSAQPRKPAPIEPAPPVPPPKRARKRKSTAAERRKPGGYGPNPKLVASRALTTGLRAECSKHIGLFLKESLRTADFDQYLTTKATEDFFDWLETGVENLLRDLKRAAEYGEQAKLSKIGSQRFWNACDVYALSKVGAVKLVFGQKNDKKFFDAFRKLVRSRHHERSLALHPDRIKGRQPTEAERTEYQAVQDARDVLEDYIRTMTEGL
jgi:hypothetical protein